MVVGERSDASPGITSNPEVAALPTGVSVGSGVTERLGGTDDPVATTFVFCEPC